MVPGIVEIYNKHMRVVDLADMLLELYKINQRSNKWYILIVYWCINSSLVHSWFWYHRDITHTDGELKHMPLINFQLDVASELLNASQTTVVAKKRGHPSSLVLTMNSETSTPSPSNPSSPAPTKLEKIVRDIK